MEYDGRDARDVVGAHASEQLLDIIVLGSSICDDELALTVEDGACFFFDLCANAEESSLVVDVFEVDFNARIEDSGTVDLVPHLSWQLGEQW